MCSAATGHSKLRDTHLKLNQDVDSRQILERILYLVGTYGASLTCWNSQSRTTALE